MRVEEATIPVETKRAAILLLSLLVVSPAAAADGDTAGSDGGSTSDPESDPVQLQTDGEGEPVLEIRGRVHAGWYMEHLSDDLEQETELRNENSFYVRRARVKLIWRPETWITALVQLNAAAILEIDDSFLKDAYVHLSPLDQIGLRVGQFKKPFSALALRSSGKLRIIERGIGHEYVVDDRDRSLQYGDRDIGAQLSGRLVETIKLDYAVGVFNGSGPNVEDSDVSKDLVARVDAKPIDQLTVGANASFKFFNEPFPGQPEWAWATGVDAQVRLFDFRLHSEAMVARDYNRPLEMDPSNRWVPYLVDFVGILSYRFRVPTNLRFILEPAFKFELLELDAEHLDDHVFLYTVGLNTYLGKYFRIMVDGEFLRSEKYSDQRGYRDQEVFMVMLCFDI
jgi:hypothetical protein